MAHGGATVQMMADILEIGESTFRHRIAEDRKLRDIIAKGRATIAVSLRATLLARSRNSVPALIFACKTLAGLIEKQAIEMSGPEGGPIPGMGDQIDQLERGLLLLERYTEARRNGPEDAPAELSAITLEHEDD